MITVLPARFNSKSASNPLKLIARVEVLENAYLKAGFNSAAAEIQDGLDGDPIKEQILFYQNGLKDLGAVLRAGFPQGEANVGRGLAFSKYVGSFIARGKSRHKSLLLCRCLDGGLEDADTEGVQHFFDSRIVLPYCVVYLQPGAQDLICQNIGARSKAYPPSAYFLPVQGAARPVSAAHEYLKIGKADADRLQAELKQTALITASAAGRIQANQTDILKPYTNPRLCTKMDEDFDLLAWSTTDENLVERQHSLDMLRDDVDKVGLRLKDLETCFEEEQSGVRQQVSEEVRELMARKSEMLRQRVDLELSGTRGQGREAEVQLAVEAASEHEQAVANTDLECVTLTGLVKMRDGLFSEIDEGGSTSSSSSSSSVWLPGKWIKVEVDRKGSVAERLKLARSKVVALEESVSKEKHLLQEQKRLKSEGEIVDVGGAKKKRWDQPPAASGNWRKTRLEMEKALAAVRIMLNEAEREVKGDSAAPAACPHTRRRRPPPVKVLDSATGRVRYRFKDEHEQPTLASLTLMMGPENQKIDDDDAINVSVWGGSQGSSGGSVASSSVTSVDLDDEDNELGSIWADP